MKNWELFYVLIFALPTFIAVFTSSKEVTNTGTESCWFEKRKMGSKKTIKHYFLPK